jgi:signal transduction histidine kinase
VEHGSETVTVWVVVTTDGFYVEDDGPGIPPEERDDVRRLGYSNNPQGNGLGLGIVNEIIEEHGWNVTLTDGREGGARIDVHCD